MSFRLAPAVLLVVVMLLGSAPAFDTVNAQSVPPAPFSAEAQATQIAAATTPSPSPTATATMTPTATRTPTSNIWVRSAAQAAKTFSGTYNPAIRAPRLYDVWTTASTGQETANFPHQVPLDYTAIGDGRFVNGRGEGVLDATLHGPIPANTFSVTHGLVQVVADVWLVQAVCERIEELSFQGFMPPPQRTFTPQGVPNTLAGCRAIQVTSTPTPLPTMTATPTRTGTPMPTATRTATAVPTATRTATPFPIPNVAMTVLPGAPRSETVGDTVFARDANCPQGNRSLKSIRFDSFSNASVTVSTTPPQHITMVGTIVAFPTGQERIHLTVHRTVPSGSATVFFTVTDGCGTWQTFAGGGENAFR